jgi:hypothetical protein
MPRRSYTLSFLVLAPLFLASPLHADLRPAAPLSPGYYTESEIRDFVLSSLDTREIYRYAADKLSKDLRSQTTLVALSVAHVKKELEGTTPYRELHPVDQAMLQHFFLFARDAFLAIASKGAFSNISAVAQYAVQEKRNKRSGRNSRLSYRTFDSMVANNAMKEALIALIKQGRR